MVRNDILKRIKTTVPIQAYTTEELALLYKITPKTFLKWLVPFQADIGQKIGWFYNIRQVTIIFEKIGQPEKDSDE